jgi:manganese/iron transport system permease protein/iron/zinc/copper transport system permease protein
VVVAALVLSVVVVFFRQFQMASFDPVMAASIGLPVVLLDYALTTCVSLVVVSAVNMVGVILVVGLLITPAATAYLLSDRLSRMMWLAALFGVTGVVGGLYLSVWLDSAGGGAVMLFSTLQFLAVLVAAPRYGLLSRWLRLRRMVPQQVQEDVLGTAYRNRGKPTTVEMFREYVQEGGKLRLALKTMVGDGLLRGGPDEGYTLTRAGEEEAGRVMRAHRLWETYLAHVGAPEAEIHAQAHHLEHIRDRATVVYLNDLLGHPKKDPSGREIPAPDDAVPVSDDAE